MITDGAILMRSKMMDTPQVNIKDKADTLQQQVDTVNQEDTLKSHPATAAVVPMEVQATEMEMNTK